MSWVSFVLKGALGFATAYLAFVVLSFFVPRFRHGVIFMHHLNVPFGDLTNLEGFGVAPGKAVRIKTKDGETLFGWHMYSGGRSSSASSEGEGAADYVLYLHGNAGNIAVYHRRRLYRVLREKVKCNVIAVDYRGYGLSSGTPSAEGLIEDALAMWDYAMQFTTPDRVAILGHSLGTGVSLGLMERLEKERHVSPRALILLAPFTSLVEAVKSHFLFKPLHYLSPALADRVEHLVDDDFPSIDRLVHVSCPLLIVHGTNDFVIPFSHGETLHRRAIEVVDSPHVEMVKIEGGFHSPLSFGDEVIEAMYTAVHNPQL